MRALLPIYLMAVAGFLLFVNIKAGATWLKFLSIAGMLAALIGSVIAAVGVYR